MRPTAPAYGVFTDNLGDPGSGGTPNIWGGIRTISGNSTGSMSSISMGPKTQQFAENSSCCKEISAIDAYILRLTGILRQLNNAKSIPIADERLDLITSDIKARIAKG